MRVVVVGGGFAGLHAAKRLGKHGIETTLLDKRNFQLFQPLLYQVATGSIPPGDIAIPHRVVLRKQKSVRAINSAAFDLDPARRRVLHEHGELEYDALIVGTGVKHNYFGHEQWEPFAPGLKTVEHAIEIRHRVFRAFELAEVATDATAQRELMTFVIVGAGPTGVELAGAIGELAHKTMVGDFRAIDPCDARILLIEGAAEVLPPFPPKLRAAARRHLEKLGVTVMTDTRVEEVGADFVRTRRGEQAETIRTRTILWAAGVRASAFGQVLADRLGVALERGFGIRVAPDCSIPGHPEVFVIGDLAKLAGADGKDVPGLAPAAIQQGRYVADLLHARARGKSPPAFRYRDWGTMAVIGMNRAVGDIKGWQSSGVLAWFLWAFVHIAALIDPAQRIRVFVQWAWKYFTRRQGDRLITTNIPRTEVLREARLGSTQSAGGR